MKTETISERISTLPATIPERWNNRYSETEEYAYRLGCCDTRKAAAALVAPLEASHAELLTYCQMLKARMCPNTQFSDEDFDALSSLIANAEKLNTK